VLLEGQAFLPEAGVALDLACGLGGNALHLAKAGFTVHAWDISETAISVLNQTSKAMSVENNLKPAVRDVIAEPPAENSFDLIIVTRFLHRPLCASLAAALKDSGVLLYQTFTKGLSNPEYMLEPGELPSLFGSLEVCLAEESEPDSDGFAESLFVGRKPAG